MYVINGIVGKEMLYNDFPDEDIFPVVTTVTKAWHELQLRSYQGYEDEYESQIGWHQARIEALEVVKEQVLYKTKTYKSTHDLTVGVL